jgi:2-ketocyclohexanecarboxyl-CoA hydrolase
MEFNDLIYTEKDGVATITINRPEKYNAFRNQTAEELIKAFNLAGWNPDIGVVVLTGIGDKAFCTGGDQSEDSHEGSYGGRGTTGMPVEDLHTIIRDIPKPVIARVNGYAIGGGHVLHILCDLTIASDNAIFGQVGPGMGSVDPGYGTAYMARLVGEKKAREIWYLCRRYSAQEAMDMGLVNKVVPFDKLDEEVDIWCQEIMAKSPTALAIAKRSFNADTEHIRGLGVLGFQSVKAYYETEESKEGVNAFREKRKPDFRKYQPR